MKIYFRALSAFFVLVSLSPFFTVFLRAGLPLDRGEYTMRATRGVAGEDE